jgi:hypothetical protein
MISVLNVLLIVIRFYFKDAADLDGRDIVEMSLVKCNKKTSESLSCAEIVEAIIKYEHDACSFELTVV